MPAQHFSLNVATAPLASVQWSAGYGTIDLTYNGTLLTRITDAESLRTTGMQGQTADGATLVLRLVPGDTGESFTLERNGARMHASEVDHAALSPTAAVVYPAVTTVGVATPAQEKVMTSARRWIRTIGIFMLIGSASVLVVSSGEKSSFESIDDAVKVGDQFYDANALRGVAIGLAVFGVLMILIVRLARGTRAKLMFGVASALCLLMALANLVGGSPLSAVIPAAIGARGLQAWKVAKAIGRPATP